MGTNLLLSLLASSFLIAVTAFHAHACEIEHRAVDINCDGIVRISIAGDSIVYGIGDTRDKEGYVGRIRHLLPDLVVENIGVPGITSGQLLRAYKRNLSKIQPGETQRKTRGSDLIIIAVGVNDYWRRELPRQTVRNVKRLVGFLQTKLVSLDGYAPPVYVSPLTPSTRTYQQPFIKEVNRYLMREAARGSFLGPRYDRMKIRYLSSDGLHPTSAGYWQLAKFTASFLKKLDPTLESFLN